MEGEGKEEEGEGDEVEETKAEADGREMVAVGELPGVIASRDLFHRMIPRFPRLLLLFLLLIPETIADLVKTDSRGGREGQRSLFEKHQIMIVEWLFSKIKISNRL